MIIIIMKTIVIRIITTIIVIIIVIKSKCYHCFGIRDGPFESDGGRVGNVCLYEFSPLHLLCRNLGFLHWLAGFFWRFHCAGISFKSTCICLA